MAPQHPAAPQHHEQADADAADAVEEGQRDDRPDADGLVGRAHARVAPAEGFRNLDEGRDLRQPVARHDKAQAIAALVQRRRATLVREGMVDPSAQPTLLPLLDGREEVEIHVPARGRLAFGETACVAGVQCRPGRVFLQPLHEAVRVAVRRETNRRLVGFTLLELADAPGVCRIEAVAQHAREDILAAAFELDERLRLFVAGE